MHKFSQLKSVQYFRKSDRILRQILNIDLTVYPLSSNNSRSELFMFSRNELLFIPENTAVFIAREQFHMESYSK